MTTAIRSCLFLVVAFAGAALFASPAKAAHFDHRYDDLDRLAVRMEREARTLANELRRYSYGDLNLRTAAREVSDIIRDASHLHSIIHHGDSLEHVHRDVVALQEAVHHVDEHLAAYPHFAAHVRTLDALMHAMDDAIHHLEHGHTVRRPVQRVVPVAPPSRGITIGNSGITIRFGR